MLTKAERERKRAWLEGIVYSGGQLTLTETWCKELLADLDAAYEALQDIHDMADDGAQSPNRAVLMDIERRAAEALGGE